VSVHEFGFDPDQPGARKLVEGYRASRDLVVVRLTRPLMWMDHRPRHPGDLLELPRELAAELVTDGGAEPLP
jgi:hypothetical protein